jgi:ABC-2 type transport system permease protein
MRAYLEFIKKSFQNNLVFRIDYLIGIANSIIIIFIYVSIWRSIYGNEAVIGGISLEMVTTNFILGLALSSAFSLDDLFVSRKIWSGEIINDLLKPMNFNAYIFCYNIGNILFKLLLQFIPALIVSSLLIGILPPATLIGFIFFTISIILGFLILYNISYIVSLITFWNHQVWSISTIKDVIVSVLSGIYIPMWFFPEWLYGLIKYTPFDSIYFIPVSIYFGKIELWDIGFNMAKQVIWIIFFYLIGRLMWSNAIKKLVIQGG